MPLKVISKSKISIVLIFSSFRSLFHTLQNIKRKFISIDADVYSEPCQTSNIELFEEIVNDCRALLVTSAKRDNF